MPSFRYSAYRGDGGEVAGVIDAASQRDAAERLKKEGLFPRTVVPAEEAATGGLAFVHAPPGLPAGSQPHDQAACDPARIGGAGLRSGCHPLCAGKAGRAEKSPRPGAGAAGRRLGPGQGDGRGTAGIQRQLCEHGGGRRGERGAGNSPGAPCRIPGGPGCDPQQGRYLPCLSHADGGGRHRRHDVSARLRRAEDRDDIRSRARPPCR